MNKNETKFTTVYESLIYGLNIFCLDLINHRAAQYEISLNGQIDVTDYTNSQASSNLHLMVRK